MPIAFRFTWSPFIATVLVVALGISLGNWQERRADEKIATRARLAQGAASAPLVLTGAPRAVADVEFRHVTVSGQFVRDWPVYLDNRPYQGRAGFYLLMPLRIAGSSLHVLVQRGWLPRDPLARTRLPAFDTPAGTVTVEGVARRDSGHVLELGAGPALTAGAIVQNAGPLQVARASGLAMAPFVLLQSAPARPGGDDLRMGREWPASGMNPEKHQGYAFQWYALAAMAVIFFVANGFRRGKSGQH
ncbi:cytochrome oxidase biosynthesis protein [Duganella sp. Leaf126]|uniref:SURF1 family protein n=1 Tax=Duganella sp. Leaf126 TaxID=1736266 RepID=UPI0006FE57BB|nr:SURF1 family protein [Duganella sp. Leaf126]KQQ47275.1 cytochrome oxidase biosynthesis protein [Duganella sp. Leaf126]